MAEPFSNPLIGMENEPIEKKLCVLQGLWVRYGKELETAFHLMNLTALVAQQYVDDAFKDEEPQSE